MAKSETNEIEMHARIEEFDAAEEFVSRVFSANKVSKEVARDVALVFEALFNSIIMQGFGPDTVLRISEKKRFGAVRLAIEFEGERYNPPGHHG